MPSSGNKSGDGASGAEDATISPESLPDKCQSLRLRSIHKRIETEKNRRLPKQRKTRERPAPLSKYRRKTANARERQRMQEVNNAFDRLKESIPHHKLNAVDEKKDTKITTLRCAITYINSLSGLLADLSKGRDVSPEYYFTDRQLGLDSEKAEGRTKGRGSKGGKAKTKGKAKKTNSKRPTKKRLNTTPREKKSKVTTSLQQAASTGAVFSQKAPIAKLISGLSKVTSTATSAIQLPQVPLEPAQLLKGPLTIVDNTQPLKRAKSQPNQHLLAFSNLAAESVPFNPERTMGQVSFDASFQQQSGHPDLSEPFPSWNRESEALIIEEISDLTPLTGVDCFVSGTAGGGCSDGGGHAETGLEMSAAGEIEPAAGNILNVQDLFISLEHGQVSPHCESMDAIVANRQDGRR